MNYTFSTYGPVPPKGTTVYGNVYISNPNPYSPPIADYKFSGQFLGECADGFMVQPTYRSDGSKDTSTIFCRHLTDGAPAGYTAEELEKDSPYNQFMYDR